MKKLALFLAAFMLMTVLVSPVAAAAEGGGHVVDPIISPTEPNIPPPSPPPTPENPPKEPPEDPEDPPEEPPEDPEDPPEEPPEDPEDPPEEPPTPPDPRLPDPNIPDSPFSVTIYDGDVPRTYIKVWDPELEEWVYVPEDEIPLISPQTGDTDYSMAGWTVLLAAAGVAVCVKRSKKDEAVG